MASVAQGVIDMSENKPNLIPCNCGGEATLYGFGVYNQKGGVRCIKCGFKTKTFADKNSAIVVWNTRPIIKQSPCETCGKLDGETSECIGRTRCDKFRAWFEQEWRKVRVYYGKE